MSVDFEKVNNRIQLLEQENKELHEQLNSLSSNKDKPKHNNGSSIWSEELEEEIVDTVSRKALLKSQDEVWKGVNFLRNCLQFMGIASLAVLIGVLLFIVKEGFDIHGNIKTSVKEEVEKQVDKYLQDKPEAIDEAINKAAAKEFKNFASNQNLILESVVSKSDNPALNKTKNSFIIAGKSDQYSELETLYNDAKRISGEQFYFGKGHRQVAKICRVDDVKNPYRLVLTSKENDNTNNAVTLERALQIQGQAIADNFRGSNLEIISQSADQTSNDFNLLNSAEKCDPL